LSSTRHPEKVNNKENTSLKKPSWLRVRVSSSKKFRKTKEILSKSNIVTVCEEASCPIFQNAGRKTTPLL
jgi:Lipoate synthase